MQMHNTPGGLTFFLRCGKIGSTKRNPRATENSRGCGQSTKEIIIPNHTAKPIQIPLPLDGETIEIPLTKGYIAIIDAIDADLLSFTWFADVKDDGQIYARRTGVKMYMHRIILARILERDLLQSEKVDHSRGNTLDNRRSQLRLANSQQSARNTKKRCTNSMGFKGVTYNHNRYKASIKISGKQIYLGTRDTPEEAHELYKQAAEKYFGEFARFD
jgi:hypothetical protein